MDKTQVLSRIKVAYNLKSDKDLALFLGITTQTLGNWKARNTLDFEIVFTKCVDISKDWLLTGKGQMLREAVEPDRIVVEKATNFSLELKKEHQLPVLEPEAVGGFGNNAFSFSEQDVTDYYVIPDFDKRNVDFIIRLTGHSMEPKFLHGDKLACKIIKENSFIEWNKPHIVATRDRGFILKRIRKSSNDLNMLMVSEDPNYEPFEVPKEEITGIALVVGVIRLE